MQKKDPVARALELRKAAQGNRSPSLGKPTLSKSFNAAALAAPKVKPTFNAAAAGPVNKQQPTPKLVLNPPGMRPSKPAQNMTMVEQKKRSAVRAAVNQARTNQATRSQSMKRGLANTPSITPSFNRAARKP
ncbi:MAG: hypothetical protein Nkreftii_002666 [Candidatus Nitrospira kreftii]|uniref:Uncharacterized protein n=1 Tax=Candidatus Nitrospira kreftii TaxID=2652173 RepID=A0A7S8IZ91_9BACT|nr:MAG: hypothetical protein Nkreftii_002666 [Candidatus Nitrospira kreftii]